MAISDHRRLDLLRLITCGSVDDGKSTLIGRLLYEQRAVAVDQLAVLQEDSRRYGTHGDQVDVALLLDGLQAEREQGITIDVAYRHFATATRRFILADTPGHEQYTRNMVTAASTADVAVILVDARKGLLRQTHRHALIASLLGVRAVIVAVNKMDLVAWSQTTFDGIAAAFAAWARELGIAAVTTIPISALHGDNVVSPSGSASWYEGPTVLEALEAVPLHQNENLEVFRFPVQWVNRPHESFRGYCGTVAAGTVTVGANIIVQPSQQRSTIAEIIGAEGSVNEVSAGDTATIVLTDDIDIARGDLLSDAASPAEVADVLQATVVWMHQEALMPGRTYLLKLGTRTVTATFHRPKYRIDPETLEHLAADTLEMNDIGVGTFSTAQPLWFEPYERNRTMGGFIVIDRYSNDTVGAGMLHHAMHRSHNVQRQELDVDKGARQRQSGHRSGIVWMTGLSGSGKTTIGNLLETSLHGQGVRTYLLDGDNIRHGLSRDLGFNPADRVENIRRVGEVAKLMVDAGLVVICAFISPYGSERDAVREMVEPEEFLEIFVDAPLQVAESRDPKGLYAKARAGEISNFTGVSAPYEVPVDPDLRVDTTASSPSESVAAIVALLRSRGIIT